jgi:hypothetical protein
MTIQAEEFADIQPGSGQNPPQNCIAWNYTGKEN